MQGADEVGSLAALEPSEPSREAGARLRLAMARRAALGHPNLLRASAVGEAEGRLFVAFECCRHPRLAELLAAGPLKPAQCARVLEGAAAGVDALSEQGLVARNLSPELVLVDPGHGGVLMDLGIPPGLMRPLPLERDPDLVFRSPEELRGQPVDVRSSVYSLGALLFTALTGVPPYEGTASEIYSSHLKWPPPSPSERRPGLSPAIEAVVARAMAGHPAKRYANGAALSRALVAAVGAGQPRVPRLADERAQARPTLRRRLELQAIGAIVASALAGIVLGRAVEPEGAPSPVTGAGMTVQLPHGWEPATSDAGRPAISPAITAGPPEDPKSRLIVAKLRSQAAAERILEGVQTGGDGRTPVQLGGLHAWRYTGLRPRQHLVGTGYLVPTAAGAVLVICGSSKDRAEIRLAECDRAASTLVVHGERPVRLSSVDQSRKRLIRAIAALRASRAEGRQRLVAAKLPTDQARAATSLQRSHQRAARSIDGISVLENGRSLGDLSAALRAAAAAYGRLAGAATIGSPFAYREASRAVVRE